MRNLTLKTRRKVSSGTLTPLLKIREKNYVIRTREEQDERNLQILTERGKDIQNVLSDISQSVFNEFNITQEETQNLVEDLQNFVTKNFDKTVEKVILIERQAFKYKYNKTFNFSNSDTI